MVALGLALGLALDVPRRESRFFWRPFGFGSPDSFLGRVLRWLLKDTILGLIWLEGLGGVGLRKTLLKGKPTPLQHLVQYTFEVGSRVLVPQIKPIVFLELLDYHPKPRLLPKRGN